MSTAKKRSASPLNPPPPPPRHLIPTPTLQLSSNDFTTAYRGPDPLFWQRIAPQEVYFPLYSTLVMQTFYHDDPAWADIEPIPQDDGGPHPLAAIAYTDEYAEAMGYLRAVMARNEFSERVLALTEHVIGMNAAHYTVWLYRAKTLDQLNKDLRKEIEWLNPTSLKHLKNYQIWHHRQTIVNKLNSPEGESDFISEMLEQDTKNYHVWSYRQWLVQRFKLYNEEEMKWTEGMIEADIRNNSAWNHRWFLVFGVPKDGRKVEDAIAQRELTYGQEAIRKAPQNQSPWNYIRGVVRHQKLPISTLKTFTLEFADIDKPDEVYSSHALDVLADIYGEDSKKEEAKKALDLLATKFDPIRANYWNYRKGLLETSAVA